MNRKIIAVAVAGALSAGSAFALDIATTAGIANQVYMSGSTAQDNGLAGAVRRLCVPGTLDAYAMSLQTAYSCTGTAAIGGAAIVIHKESSGGSDLGVVNVNNSVALNYVDVTKLASSSCTSSAKASVAPVAGSSDTLGLPGYTAWSCSSNTVSVVPQIGFSDVEPNLFGAPAGNLTVTTHDQIGFGAAITVALRNALQGAQGLAVGSELAADQPSLAASQVAAIYSGSLGFAGSDFGIAGDTNPIYVVRRDGSSGTQKTAETYFFNLNVTTVPYFPISFLAPDNGLAGGSANQQYCGDASTYPTNDDVIGGITVFAGNGGGAVQKCLQRHQAGHRYAIGVLGTAVDANNVTPDATIKYADTTTVVNPFRWVKINGYLPTIANIIAGKYDYFSEAVITHRSAGWAAGPVKSVHDAILAQFKGANALPALNSAYTKYTDLPAGQQSTGFLAVPNTASCPAALGGSVTADNSPVNVSTKTPVGASLPKSSIKPPLQVCANR